MALCLRFRVNAICSRPARRGAGIALLLLGLLGGRAHAQDSTFARLSQRSQYAMTLSGTQFSGPGWDKLQQDIRQSQLVLLGEDHGTAQIPVFATALARELKPAVYVAEIDQYQAQDLSQLATQPGLPTAFQKAHPMGLAFYSLAEEFELARYLRSQHAAILGIDQVSLVSTGRFFTMLASKVKNASAKAYLVKRAAAYQAQDRAKMSKGTGNFSIYQRPSALDSLRSLTRTEGPEVQQMVHDFAASNDIYQLNQQGDPRSHQLRINLMKRNLLKGLAAYQRPGQPLPTMLFKFGAMHVSRGVSLNGGVYDVGNLALNLADAHDQKSLHIYLMGQRGTRVQGFNPDDFSKNVAAYSSVDELKPFTVPAGSTAWQVFDLRPLRRALRRDQLKVANYDLEVTLLGYDYLIIIPETTASHNY
jgi:hypothetical protein